MSELSVTHLTADYLQNPMGIVAPPQFAWQLRSDAQNVCQTACRLWLYGDAAMSDPLWDSGMLPRTDSAHYRPAALPLESARRYWWRVWVQAGGMECVSQPGTFVTGLLEGFAGEMITSESPSDAARSHVTAVSRTLHIDGEVEAAYLYCTALGLYHIFIDSKRAGDAELAPGWTSYHKHLCYQTIELTDLLTAGEHNFSAWLGVGWYKGRMGFLHASNNYGDRTAFLGQIEIRYRDGRRQRVVTDTQFAGSDTPILFADIYDGETCDARLGLHHERPVSVVPWDTRVLTAQAGGVCRVAERLPVRAVLLTQRGETVLDFGQNHSGVVEMRMRGKAGDTAELQCFEVLDAQGNVYTANLRSARQTIRYTMGRGGEETYRALFTFQGYRYVHIKAWPGEVRAEDFTALVIHSDMEKTGAFECSDPLLNRLWLNILWGLKSNFVDIPTDCPQRDERMGWTGDAQVFSATACLLMNTYPFFDKWLTDLVCDQTAEGGVPHVVPDTLTGAEKADDNWLVREGTHSAAAWADAAVIIPWNLYLAYGDTDILRKQYDSMAAWVRFMKNHAEGGMWTYRLQLGDYFGATPLAVTCTAYYAYSARLMANIAALLGRHADAAEFAALSSEAKDAFIRHFFTPEGEMTAQTQTAHVLALHFDLVPDAWREQTLAGLRRLVAQHGGHLVTGFVGTPYIAHALSDNGALADAYSLLMKRDFPSWLYQVEMGATTVWEHWDGIKPDGTMWSAGMNSFNHYAYGAIGEWLVKNIGGLRTDERAPGYRHSILTPQVGGGLTFADVREQTVYGELAVRWTLEGARLTVRATVPCNTTATLCRPQNARGAQTVALGSGTHTVVYEYSA
jgi:alpha-L-rhamnosidase